MTRMTESPSWEDEIDIIGRTERVTGGQDGVANRPLKLLANRTRFLKEKYDENAEDISGKVEAIKTFIAGAVLTSPRDEILSGNYRLVWTGAFPKTVPPNSSPVSTGGIGAGRWAYTSDAAIRQEMASGDEGLGADMFQTSFGVSVGEAMRAPAVITGRVNIRNACWNAPQEGAEDDEAADANTAAINKMIQAEGKHVELDSLRRQINAPLCYAGRINIHGAGRGNPSLVWVGGDAPAIARANYTDKDAKGFPNVRLRDLHIIDMAPSRVSHYTVDLSNGNSSGLDGCWIDCPGRKDASGNMIVTADRYGVLLGLARNTTLKGEDGFVAHMKGSRITNGTLMINGTDYNISDCELWGAYRERAVELSAGGTIGDGTQIVPGREAGIFLFNDNNYDIDTMKLIGVYFDGSTNTDLFTGWGIKSAEGIGLVSAEIVACDFWHINQGGIYVSKLYSSTIESNFRDCDSDDTGEDDIYCDDVYNTKINNRHFRGLAPKKGDASRVNLGRPLKITAKPGYPISSIGGSSGFSGSYARSSISNPTFVRQLGGSFATSFPYGSLPDAASRYGEFIVVGGKPYSSDGARWRDMSGDLTALETATDLHALTVSAGYYTSDITRHSNIPPGVTGAAEIYIGYISAGYRVITVLPIKTSGGIYKQRLDDSRWGEWVKTSG